MHPELGFELPRTLGKIKEFLDNEGIEYKKFGISGLCGIIKGEKDDNGKVIGIRADMDALPIRMQESLSVFFNGKRKNARMWT